MSGETPVALIGIQVTDTAELRRRMSWEGRSGFVAVFRQKHKPEARDNFFCFSNEIRGCLFPIKKLKNHKSWAEFFKSRNLSIGNLCPWTLSQERFQGFEGHQHYTSSPVTSTDVTGVDLGFSTLVSWHFSSEWALNITQCLYTRLLWPPAKPFPRGFPDLHWSARLAKEYSLLHLCPSLSSAEYSHTDRNNMGNFIATHLSCLPLPISPPPPPWILLYVEKSTWVTNLRKMFLFTKTGIYSFVFVLVHRHQVTASLSLLKEVSVL